VGSGSGKTGRCHDRIRIARSVSLDNPHAGEWRTGQSAEGGGSRVVFQGRHSLEGHHLPCIPDVRKPAKRHRPVLCWSRPDIAGVRCSASRSPQKSARAAEGTPSIKGREGLVGQQVIAIRGYSYGGLAAFLSDPQNRITTHDTQAHASAFRMLANGRADYLIEYAGPAAEVLSAEPIAGIAFDVLSRQDVHLVLSKSYPDAAQVMQRLEAIAATLDVEALLARRLLASGKGVAGQRGNRPAVSRHRRISNTQPEPWL
jgi:ABC-type amino acid transport substrate-binding protein